MQEDYFKNRGEVKTEINKCAWVSAIVTLLGFLFAVIGVIGDIIDETLGLETTTWLLLAIFFGIAGLGPRMHSVAAKHLYGIEEERKKKD